MLQLHSGDSYGYRFEADERKVVYTTDSEHKLEEAGEPEKYAFFFRDADLVIFDAMYSLAEAISASSCASWRAPSASPCTTTSRRTTTRPSRASWKRRAASRN